MSARARLEFGELACTAGLAPCGCALCSLEDLAVPTSLDLPHRKWQERASYKTVTPITQGPARVADTLSNGEWFARETKMTNKEMFNPSARDGAALFVGLRLIPVALVLALVFQAVVG